MNEKFDSSNKLEEDRINKAASVAPADEALDTVLGRLPTQFREEILKQYDLPDVNVSIFTIFRYATPLEYAMQIIGILMAFLAGIYASFRYSIRWKTVLIDRCCFPTSYYCDGEYDEYFWSVLFA